MSDLPPGFQPPPPPENFQPPLPPLPPGPPTSLPAGFPPGGYPPPGYPPPGYQGGQVIAAPHNNQKALVSMIVGIAGVLFAVCCFPIGLVMGGVSLGLGLIARREIEGSGGAQAGGGMAIAGIVLGALELLWVLFVIVIIIASIASGNFHGVTPGPGIPSR